MHRNAPAVQGNVDVGGQGEAMGYPHSTDPDTAAFAPRPVAADTLAVDGVSPLVNDGGHADGARES